MRIIAPDSFKPFFSEQKIYHRKPPTEKAAYCSANCGTVNKFGGWFISTPQDLLKANIHTSNSLCVTEVYSCKKNGSEFIYNCSTEKSCKKLGREFIYMIELLIYPIYQAHIWSEMTYKRSEICLCIPYF